MLAEFAGEMVECERVWYSPGGSKVLITREPYDPVEKAKNRAEILRICAQIQKDLIRKAMEQT